MDRAKEIRCPGNRKHNVHSETSEIEYQTCGSLLGGLGEHSSAIFRCPICKQFWKAYFDEDNVLVIDGITKGTHLDLEKSVRRIHVITGKE